MNVFFDNCTSPRLAAVLAAFLAHDGHRAVHLRDLPCGAHAPDLERIAFLSGSGDTWMIITGDGRIARNKAERTAYRQAGLRGFVLAPAYQKIPLNQVAASILWQWPAMLQIFGLTTGAALFELSIRRGSRFRPMPL